MRALLSRDKKRGLPYEQIERCRSRLQQTARSSSGQLGELMKVEFFGGEKGLLACPASHQLP
jgi:hypothetical protein